MFICQAGEESLASEPGEEGEEEKDKCMLTSYTEDESKKGNFSQFAKNISSLNKDTEVMETAPST